MEYIMKRPTLRVSKCYLTYINYSYTFLFLCLILIYADSLGAQEPVGDPNEVWISISPSGSLRVGEPAELKVFMANQYEVQDLLLLFAIYSPDSSTWQWSDEIVSIVPGSRFEGVFELYYVAATPVPLSGGPIADTLSIHGSSISPPGMANGELEHMLSINFTPISPGIICIDSTRVDPWWDDYWLFYPPMLDPAWAGPFCFTVEPPKGDVDCSGEANVGDVVYLINWIFMGGPEPCK
jgi:hypothetical protein